MTAYKSDIFATSSIFYPDRMTDPIVPHGQNKSPESDLWKIKQWLAGGLIVSCWLLNLSSAFSGRIRKSFRQSCVSWHSGHHHLLESVLEFGISGNKVERGMFDTSHYGVVNSFVQLSLFKMANELHYLHYIAIKSLRSKRNSEKRKSPSSWTTPHSLTQWQQLVMHIRCKYMSPSSVRESY